MVTALLNIIALVLGVFIVLRTLYSAAMTTMHPWPRNSWLATQTFRAVYLFFKVPLAIARTQPARRHVMGTFGPIALACVPFAWFLAVMVGFALIFWALGVGTPYDSLLNSGSSLSTLGFQVPSSDLEKLLAIIEGAIGVGLIGFWITFLPGIVAIGTQRDELVSQFALIAGTPPSGPAFLEAFYVARQADQLENKWAEWTNWFVFLRDTHPEMPVVSAVRAMRPELSWVTTAGAILDGAALAASTIDQPADLNVSLCLRAGIAALGDIEAAIQSVFRWLPESRVTQGAHDAHRISREAYDAACDRMAQAGIPLKVDRDQAWRDFSAWRSQYGPGLESLAKALSAPPAPWLQ